MPVERLLNEEEFFTRLDASKYRFMALFGVEHAEPFDTIKKVRNRVVIASGMLIRTYGERMEEPENLRRSREKWERNIGIGLTEQDPLADEVVAVIFDVERTRVISLPGRE